MLGLLFGASGNGILEAMFDIAAEEFAAATNLIGLIASYEQVFVIGLRFLSLLQHKVHIVNGPVERRNGREEVEIITSGPGLLFFEILAVEFFLVLA